MTGSVYALLVGINDYRVGVRPLSGCIDDVEQFESFLVRRVDQASLHIEKMLDDKATRQRVVDAFSTHLKRAGPGDVAVFFFAGHGSYETVDERLWFLEPTGRNQTLVCADSRRDGIPDLADKELSHLISEVAQRGPHMLVVLDCCHSGGATRDPGPMRVGATFRAAPPSEHPRPLESYLPSIREAAARAGTAAEPAQHHVTRDSRTAISALSPLDRPR
ncbi:MAG: caspase family protein, partial [Acidimicrobiales bacterium]